MADRRLQVFHTVARLLSFTKAAEALHITQPAATFQIRQLEEYFSTRLFDRTHNRISLTAAGERVFEHADRIIAFGPTARQAVLRCLSAAEISTPSYAWGYGICPPALRKTVIAGARLSL